MSQLVSHPLALPPPEERRRIREAAGLTRADIGELLHVTFAAVAHWEAGRRSPSGPRRLAYLRLLDELRKVAR